MKKEKMASSKKSKPTLSFANYLIESVNVISWDVLVSNEILNCVSEVLALYVF